MRLETWLSLHDFRFNPFAPDRWVAENDASLYRYFITHPLVHTLQYPQPEWILAEPGSGKTALRRYVMFLLWDRFLRAGENAPFPLFLPASQDFFEDAHPSSIDRLWTMLIRQAAALLLLAVAYSPRLFFFDKPLETRERLRALWAQSLPGGLDMARDLIRRVYQRRTFLPFSQLYRIDFVQNDAKWITSDDKAINVFLQELRESTLSNSAKLPTLWPTLQVLLQEGFHVAHFYVFIDGLDNYLLDNEERCWRPLGNTFWAFLEQLYQADLMPKIFAPEDAESSAMNYVIPYTNHSFWRFSSLNWTSPRLRELIDRRIVIASEEIHLGLDDLVQVEVVKEVGLLSRRISRRTRTPREALQMIFWLFQTAAEQNCELITRPVVERALHAFLEESRMAFLR